MPRKQDDEISLSGASDGDEEDTDDIDEEELEKLRDFIVDDDDDDGDGGDHNASRTAAAATTVVVDSDDDESFAGDSGDEGDNKPMKQEPATDGDDDDDDDDDDDEEKAVDDTKKDDDDDDDEVEYDESKLQDTYKTVEVNVKGETKQARRSNRKRKRSEDSIMRDRALYAAHMAKTNPKEYQAMLNSEYGVFAIDPDNGRLSRSLTTGGFKTDPVIKMGLQPPPEKRQREDVPESNGSDSPVQMTIAPVLLVNNARANFVNHLRMLRPYFKADTEYADALRVYNMLVPLTMQANHYAMVMDREREAIVNGPPDAPDTPSASSDAADDNDGGECPLRAILAMDPEAAYTKRLTRALNNTALTSSVVTAAELARDAEPWRFVCRHIRTAPPTNVTYVDGTPLPPDTRAYWRITYGATRASVIINDEAADSAQCARAVCHPIETYAAAVLNTDARPFGVQAKFKYSQLIDALCEPGWVAQWTQYIDECCDALCAKLEGKSDAGDGSE